ncbi:MAG TPA: maleylpyruvate isomerase N-terminal domain-containing protein, partial [Candidatus Acidoferrales bacterium]|nr:maleylpyruvate isomerase N-terminal domain-containing protein [Candidatus Acidoferrales bacterium]
MSEPRKTAPPILVANLFPDIRTGLLEVLESLSPADWERPTAAPLWSVKDVALHLLGGDLGNLSRRRDQFVRKASVAAHQDLVAFINNLNDEWIRAARRLSPRALCDLLAFTGPQLAGYFASLNPFDFSEPVSWAGPEPAPVWLDVAREYTEQWHHQQQIRDATGKPPLYQPRYFAPVLDTFMRAAPHHYRDLVAPEATCIAIQITGEAGGQWFLH